jgi:D-3-phosphoglycerate dehydrogenase
VTSYNHKGFAPSRANDDDLFDVCANSIPVASMTELGIPVFNTPGANANAVKELILCGMLLGSRRVVDGINHMKELGSQGLARERVEKDKSMFGGQEIEGKTLAVIGLGKFLLDIPIRPSL